MGTGGRLGQALGRTDGWRALAPVVMLGSVVVSVIVNSATDPIDFHIYVLGGAALEQPGSLYHTAYLDPAHHETMPFVYPPFAAMVFYPLHFVPFGLAVTAWRLGIIAALFVVIRLSQKMIGVVDDRVAMLWSAGAIWLEPIVGNIKHATIGVFLMILVMAAASGSRWWLSGLLLGLGTGIKLTPAAGGLYCAGMRRPATAGFAATVFIATLAVSSLVAGDRVRYFFTDFIGQDKLFTYGNVYNQSWRGGIARIVGHDPGMGPLVWTAIAATALLAACAWWALGDAGSAPDRLGRLLVVMLVALVASPVSWTAHWVWLVPLLIWLLHGPWREAPGARWLWWAWAVTTLAAVPNMLAQLQVNRWEISRPWYEAWAGLIYPILTLATLAWLVATGLAARRRQHPPTGTTGPGNFTRKTGYPTDIVGR
ncbi:mannosyltransferase [Mycolicibacterium mucogenicum]|uniref:mannosyltransferase n=1 Tax=Mycolicibacterium mucogenicum TaxID=56689 RepID=UPI000B131AC5|nr:mannosyltransferase [Mycolicibacterium mucogenicum]